MRPDLLEDAIYYVLWAMGIICTLILVVACVIAPFYGVWEPDLAVAFWAVVAGIVYVVYRVLKWRDRC